MKKYIKPSIKIKKIRINSFLSNPFKNNFDRNDPNFYLALIAPENSGSAGLKQRLNTKRKDNY